VSTRPSRQSLGRVWAAVPWRPGKWSSERAGWPGSLATYTSRCRVCSPMTNAPMQLRFLGDAESVASLTGIENNLLPYWLTKFDGHP
jgi:hypothetical protein